MKILRFNDPLVMPESGESPEQCLKKAAPLLDTPGQLYVEKRGIPVNVADAAGLMFDVNFYGRPAVVFPLHNQYGHLTALHGRYLNTRRGENKMFTFGSVGGVACLLKSWKSNPLILVEGVFDALSLACCGWESIATVGRWASWLPEVLAGRVVWLAFDNSRPGESEVNQYTQRLKESHVRRLPPPALCKDWNTALVKRGSGAVTKWVQDHIAISSG